MSIMLWAYCIYLNILRCINYVTNLLFYHEEKSNCINCFYCIYNDCQVMHHACLFAHAKPPLCEVE